MQMSLRDMGSFGQPGEVNEGPAHPQTDEEELRDELWAKRQKGVKGGSRIVQRIRFYSFITSHR